MANSATESILKIDSTGNITQVTFPIKVLAIDYIGSADAWTAVIQVTDGGQTLFRGDSSIANQKNFFKYYGGVQVQSLFAKTLTNITEVLIYYTSPGR